MFRAQAEKLGNTSKNVKNWSVDNMLFDTLEEAKAQRLRHTLGREGRSN